MTAYRRVRDLTARFGESDRLLKSAMAIALALPIAYGAGRMDRPAVAALSSVEQTMNIQRGIDHEARLAALSRHSFAPAARPMPRPKPAKLRLRHIRAVERAAADIARREGVPPDLFLALVFAESAFDPAARSSAGAIGLAQLMPATARELGVDPHDPVQNLTGGARYLRRQYERFGSWPLALAAYNAGPERVRRAGGVPPIRETRNYVRKVITLASI